VSVSAHEMTAEEIRDRREELGARLAAGEIHIARVLQHPDAYAESIPIGDILCCCDGLDEGKVSRLLATCDVNWGRRISLLTASERELLLAVIKRCWPHLWESWRGDR
jgi:hypothetical protein